MWGGKVTRKRFRAAKRTEIAVIAGQKILGAMALCSASPPGEAIKIVKGETIRAKTHAEIGTTAHLSIIGDEGTGRDRDDCAAVKIGVVAGPNSKECIEPLDILAFYWRPPCIGIRPGCPLTAQYVGPAVSINPRDQRDDPFNREY
jgi:hypothetical protein